MITVEARPGAALRLGYTGENLARRVRIPVGGWLQLYGRDGVFVLTVVRDGEVTPYPAVLEQEGDNLFWEIRGEDVAIDGTGECQLQYIVDGVVAKEEKWVTTVEPSMDAPGEYPEPPEKGWLQQVAQDGASARTAARLAGEHAETASRMAAAAEKSAEAVLDMEVQAESLPEGYEATVMKTAEDGVVRLKFGIPAGQKGDRGYPGYTPVKGKDYYTEADKQEIAEQAAELIDVPEGGGGTTDHSKLTNRDLPDQHPIEAITGLADALKAKLTKDDVDSVLAQAKESGEFDGKDGKDGLDGQPGKDGQDGYTPVKGKDYYTEADKAELVEEVLEQMPEQPSGGISVDKAEIGQTIVVKAVDENGKPTEWEAADLPEGGGSAIIDVTELPTEDINEDVFYRLLTGTFVFDRVAYPPLRCLCVESLPEVGEPVTTDGVTITAYYSVQDKLVFIYVDENVSIANGLPVGWYHADTIAPAFGIDWKGVITNVEEDNGDGIYLLLGYTTYQWVGKWESLKSVGWAGEAGGAEIFNYPSNVASARFATARGYNTEARGENSVSEGQYTIAVGRNQHVQGKRNVVDEEDEAGNSKYAHIVGNGSINSRSNAHTLNWSGLGWFAGGLKVGGTGQDDAEAVDVLTTKDMDDHNTAADAHADIREELAARPAWVDLTPVFDEFDARFNYYMLESGGQFTGTIKAGSSNQAPGTALLRNSKLVSTDTTPTVNGEINWTYG